MHRVISLGSGPKRFPISKPETTAIAPSCANWPGYKLCFLFRDLVVRVGAGSGGSGVGSSKGA